MAIDLSSPEQFSAVFNDHMKPPNVVVPPRSYQQLNRLRDNVPVKTPTRTRRNRRSSSSGSFSSRETTPNLLPIIEVQRSETSSLDRVAETSSGHELADIDTQADSTIHLTSNGREKLVRETPGVLPFDDTESRQNANAKALASCFGIDDAERELLYLCWGQSNACEILTVEVNHADDDTTAFEKARKAWYKQRGSWRKLDPFYSVANVEPGTMWTAGAPKKSFWSWWKSNIRYGRYETDVTGVLARLDPIASHELDKDSCSIDMFGDIHHMRDVCGLNNFMIGEGECAAVEVRKAQRLVAKLQRQQYFLPLAFRHPEIAARNRLLRGVLIYHEDLLEKVRYDYDAIADIPLPCLVITEGWFPYGARFAILMALVGCVSIVGFSRLIFADWNVAFGAGSFVVTLLTLLRILCG